MKVGIYIKNRKIKKNKNQKEKDNEPKFKKLTVKNINNWKLKILKKNFKFNSLFSPNNYNNYEKKMMCIIDLAWESLSKNLEANWNFFLFLSLPVQFLTTEKKNPILLEQVCVNPRKKKFEWEKKCYTVCIYLSN